MDRRVKLKSESQQKLFRLVKERFSLVELSRKFNISYSTMKKYSQTDLLLPESLFRRLLDINELSTQDFQFTYLEAHWGRREGGKRRIALLKRNSPETLVRWRKNANRKSALSNTIAISIPQLDEKLAEFIGIYLGDGTLTPYFLKITGDYRYDLPYFAHIQELVKILFGISPKVYKDRNSNACNLVIFSKQLCSFLNTAYNLRYGDKLRNNTIIPDSVMQSPPYSLACLRGLVDTDGSVSRRGRNGSQFTICLTSHNPNLIEQVKSISDNHKLFTFISKNKDQIGTNNESQILRYFKLVGSSNLRHIVRFNERFFNSNTLYQHEVANYYQKPFYSQIKLPFRLAL